MSALLPKADMCGPTRMSALGQKRTSESSNLSVAALGFPLYLQLQNAEAVALLAMASAYERTLERTTSPTLAVVVSPTGALQCQSKRGLLGWTNSTLYWVPVNKAARSASYTSHAGRATKRAARHPVVLGQARFNNITWARASVAFALRFLRSK